MHFDQLQLWSHLSEVLQLVECFSQCSACPFIYPSQQGSHRVFQMAMILDQMGIQSILTNQAGSSQHEQAVGTLFLRFLLLANSLTLFAVDLNVSSFNFFNVAWKSIVLSSSSRPEFSLLSVDLENGRKVFK